jgi:DNA-binding LacI/PurR family transcriptional regulator
MARRVSSRDVARLAGVSRTTVSFVLNNVPGMRISEETRKRVLEAAKELDYHPDAVARRLVTGKTQILAYVERQTPELAFSDAFMPQALRGVHAAASVNNYEVLFAPIPVDKSNGRFLGLLRGRHVDGIILAGPRTDDEELRELIENQSPIVVQGQWPGQNVASVDVDNMKAAQIATEHLTKLGHKRIGMIVHAPETYTAGGARLQGYRLALENYGIPYDKALVTYANFTSESGESAFKSVFEVDTPPSALFVSSDTVAIGVIQSAQELGYRVPEDLAVVGFDDIPMSVYITPPLTTVHLPAYGIGWAAADLLIRLIDSEETLETSVLLDTELIVRGSCGTKMHGTESLE